MSFNHHKCATTNREIISSCGYMMDSCQSTLVQLQFDCGGVWWLYTSYECHGYSLWQFMQVRFTTIVQVHCIHVGTLSSLYIVEC